MIIESSQGQKSRRKLAMPLVSWQKTSKLAWEPFMHKNESDRHDFMSNSRWSHTSSELAFGHMLDSNRLRPSHLESHQG